MTYPTLNDRLLATGGRPAGFDYLRIILASAVIFFHSFDLTWGYPAAIIDLHGVFRPFYIGALPMFFALSGFLVAGSLERSRTLISFLGLRVIRLMPALIVETVLSALVIGMLFTTFPYKKYFSDPLFAHYFLNIIGDVHFHLPGVFQRNPSNCVNYQMWTIPWELRCYLAISVLAVIGIARKKSLFLFLVLLVNLAFWVHHVFFGPLHLHRSVAGVPFVGYELVLAFLYGITFYLFRSRVIWNKWLFLAALIFSFLATSMKFAFWGDLPAIASITYVTIYLGLLEPARLKIVSSGDYSYGIYLYGYPVQQALIATMGAAGMHWYVNFPLTWMIAGIIAVGSWHLVEKHAAQLRPVLFNAEKLIMGWAAAMRQFVVRPGLSTAETRLERTEETPAP